MLLLSLSTKEQGYKSTTLNESPSLLLIDGQLGHNKKLLIFNMLFNSAGLRSNGAISSFTVG